MTESGKMNNPLISEGDKIGTLENVSACLLQLTSMLAKDEGSNGLCMLMLTLLGALEYAREQ